MGFLKKMVPTVPDAGQFVPGVAPAAPVAPGQVGVAGTGAMDPAMFGGPSNQPLAIDDPLLQPIAGVSLDQYAQITKMAANQGITDEVGVCGLAETQGVPSDSFKAAIAGWNERMRQSMVIGQRFNQTYMAS